MKLTTLFLLPAVLLQLTLASGGWLSNTGRPLNSFILTLHKLIALGTTVVTVFDLVKHLQPADIQVVSILLLVIAGICAMVLFGSGALMSLGTLRYVLIRKIHRIATALLLIALGSVVYFFIIE